MKISTLKNGCLLILTVFTFFQTGKSQLAQQIASDRSFQQVFDKFNQTAQAFSDQLNELSKQESGAMINRLQSLSEKNAGSLSLQEQSEIAVTLKFANLSDYQLYVGQLQIFLGKYIDLDEISAKDLQALLEELFDLLNAGEKDISYGCPNEKAYRACMNGAAQNYWSTATICVLMVFECFPCALLCAAGNAIDYGYAIGSCCESYPECCKRK